MIRIRNPISRTDLNKKLDEECKILVKLTKEILIKPQVRYPGVGIEKCEGFDIGFKKYFDGETVISVNPSTREIGVYEEDFCREACKLNTYFFSKGYRFSLVEEFN